MPKAIVAAAPLLRKDLVTLAACIKTTLRHFHSKPCPEGQVFIKSIDKLVELGYCAAMTYGCYEKYDALLQLFLFSHPDRKRLKLQNVFTQTVAELMYEGALYTKVKGCAPLDEEFTRVALEILNLMVTHQVADVTTLHSLFKPFVAPVKRPWEVLE